MTPAASGNYTFTWIDWAVVIGYLAFTTILGAKLSGRQATMRDFFLGGRRLPWFAVAGSIIATEISAVTFVTVPAMLYAEKGNFTYLQLGLGTILARIIVGYWFVPAFYEREIYSPYDYMGQRLGPRVKQVVTGLFLLGQLLGQGVRVYLTAIVLHVVTDGRLSVDVSIWVIGLVSIGWTLMGGIATVIWTDVMLFLLFFGGAIVSMLFIAGHVPGGWSEIIANAASVDKFKLLDFSTEPTLAFTFWCGLIASTWGSLNAYGTDQLLAQRMFCCRGERPARRAIIASSAGLLVTVTCMMVGIGLYSYYKHFPLSPADAADVAQEGSRIFPKFIVRVIPPGLTGLIVAAIFAAAISSLDSVLAAMSQTFVSAFLPPKTPERRAMAVSRALIVVFGVVLSGMAYVAIEAKKAYADILNLALAMAGYTGGAMLAGFMLAFLKIRVNDLGLVWSAPLSVVAVFAVAWKQPWAIFACWAACAVLLGLWITAVARSPGRYRWKTPIFLLGIGTVVTLQLHFVPIAWPWYIPIGSIVAFVWGWWLADRAP
ncbi:MAG: hypothetical protein HYY16_09745 [Planctomycetes bacterium]|nr:hypothetical protein [Planctomycetota bacterium]